MKLTTNREPSGNLTILKLLNEEELIMTQERLEELQKLSNCISYTAHVLDERGWLVHLWIQQSQRRRQQILNRYT
jgi:hypothetical protein